MVIQQRLTLVGGIVLAGIGSAMAITNPGQNAYESYATEKLIVYIKENVCAQASDPLGFLQPYCRSLIDTSHPHIQELITQQTQRQNFIFFSLYQTQLAIAAFPGYRVETVGVFQNFYTYEIERL